MTDRRTKIVLRKDSTAKKTKPVTSEYLAVIKETRGLTLSHGFNSIRLEIGIEIPWPCTPGDLSSLSEGVLELSKALEARLDRKAKTIEQVLKDLASG